MTPEAKFVKGTYLASDVRVLLTLLFCRAFQILTDSSWHSKVPPLPDARIGAFTLTYRIVSPARVYEKAHGRDRGDLQCFFDGSLPHLRHPEVRQWGDTLASERERDLPADVDGRGGA